MEFLLEDDDIDDGIGPDTISEEVEADEDADEADNGSAQTECNFEPQAPSLVCRNRVNTFVIRLKNYPWFSA
jgi:hypothetical protein